jgi:DVNP family
MSHIKASGSKAEVWHGTAKHTSGGLHKKDLMKHHGRIISRKKHAAGKKAIKHLFAMGYKPKKGTFKLMRKSMAKSSRRHSRKRGGDAMAAGMPDLAKLMGASGK